MDDDIDPDRLLLGTRGWPRAEWRGGYFPGDLPQDWEFAYYSNEAGCLLLPAADWLALERGQVEEWLEECEPWFRFYLESPPGAFPGERLGWFGAHLGGLLTTGACSDTPEGVPLWRPGQEPGHWVGHHPRARLLEWDVTGQDLRCLRERLQAAPADTHAIVIRGMGVDPAMLAELRTLAELLGRG